MSKRSREAQVPIEPVEFTTLPPPQIICVLNKKIYNKVGVIFIKKKRRIDFVPLKTGQRFGHLTVIREADTDKRQLGCRILYECKCDCGRITLVDSWALKSGHKV